VSSQAVSAQGGSGRQSAAVLTLARSGVLTARAAVTAADSQGPAGGCLAVKPGRRAFRSAGISGRDGLLAGADACLMPGNHPTHPGAGEREAASGSPFASGPKARKQKDSKRDSTVGACEPETRLPGSASISTR
jgi:hypothetical protein